MRLGLTTEGAETPVRAARKEACERIRFAQLGRNSPTLDGRQMICGRGVDEWHEVRLPPSSFRAPRSGFPRFQWLTDLSTAPPYQVRPFARPGHRQLGPLGTNGPYTFCLHPFKAARHASKSLPILRMPEESAFLRSLFQLRRSSWGQCTFATIRI